MILVRLSLAALALIALAACNNDATGPEASRNEPARVKTQAGPVLSTGYIGSGMRAGADTVLTTVSSSSSTVAPQ